MRVSMMVACVLLVSGSRALGCFEHPAEQASWLADSSSSARFLAMERAERTVSLQASLAGAGLASLVLVGVFFRAMVRGRTRSAKVAPALPEMLPSIAITDDGWRRIDPGHEWPAPAASVSGPRDRSSVPAV